MIIIADECVENCLLSSKIEQILPQLIKEKCLNLHVTHLSGEESGEFVYYVGQQKREGRKKSKLGSGEDEHVSASFNSPTLTPKTEPYSSPACVLYSQAQPLYPKGNQSLLHRNKSCPRTRIRSRRINTFISWDTRQK